MARQGPCLPQAAPSITAYATHSRQTTISALGNSDGLGNRPTITSGKRKIFDDGLLDKLFPKKRTYHETAPRRRKGDKPEARGFAYTHGTRVDESESEDEE